MAARSRRVGALISLAPERHSIMLLFLGRLFRLLRLLFLFSRFLSSLVEVLFLTIGHQLIDFMLLIRRTVGRIVVDVIAIGNIVENAGFIWVDWVLIFFRIDEMMIIVGTMAMMMIIQRLMLIIIEHEL